MDVEDEEEEDDDVEEEDVDVEEENGAQDREAHFAGACAVEMHMDMSQEPFCVEMRREKSHPDAGTDMPLQFPGDGFAPRF